MRYAFINNFEQILAQAVSESDTTITLDGGGDLMSNASAELVYVLTLFHVDTNGNETKREIVHVVGASGNVLTVGRAQEGTTAQGWAPGDGVSQRLTAHAASNFYQVSSPLVLGVSTYNDTVPGSVIMGDNAAGDGAHRGIAIGDGEYGGEEGISIGFNIYPSGNHQISIGGNIYQTGENAIGIGWDCAADSVAGIAIGMSTSVSPGSTGGISIGASAAVSGGYGIAMGSMAAASAEDTIALGQGAQSSAQDGIAQGRGASVFGARGVSIGEGSQSNGDSFAGGASADASSEECVAIGASASAQPPQCVSVGAHTSAQNVGQTLLGYGASGSGVAGGLVVHGLSHLVSVPSHPAGAMSGNATRQTAFQVVIQTDPLDLTDDTAAVSVELPPSTLLYMDSIDLVIVGSDDAGGSPEVVVGPDNQTPADYLAATAVTKTAVGGREIHEPLIADGVSRLRVATAVAGTGTNYQAKIVFRGYVMEL